MEWKYYFEIMFFLIGLGFGSMITFVILYATGMIK
jgi:hypothetical protein